MYWDELVLLTARQIRMIAVYSWKYVSCCSLTGDSQSQTTIAHFLFDFYYSLTPTGMKVPLLVSFTGEFRFGTPKTRQTSYTTDRSVIMTYSTLGLISLLSQVPTFILPRGVYTVPLFPALIRDWIRIVNGVFLFQSLVWLQLVSG